ncbi:MAG TPA: hypothetical protein VJO54_06670 [Burkholderiales bacterium]|nr:hypothetical protein [Burkholderiales bacterium]
MIRAPNELARPPAGPRRAASRRAWIWGCVLLVLLTWTPVLTLHVRNMSVADPGTGMLIAVFPPTASARDVFRSIGEARGAPVSAVSWVPRAWVVQSAEAGFAGRLRERGAWGVYSPNLLSVRQVLSCSGMVTARPSAAPGSAS